MGKSALEGGNSGGVGGGCTGGYPQDHLSDRFGIHNELKLGEKGVPEMIRGIEFRKGDGGEVRVRERPRWGGGGGEYEGE